MTEAEFSGIAGSVLLILGILAIILSLLSNFLPIGIFSDCQRFGYQQITGISTGVIFIASGAFLSFKK
jgi:hypothetical protein